MAAVERPVAVVLETVAGPLLAQVDPARWQVHDAGTSVELRSGALGPVRAARLDGVPPELDPAQPPLTGAQVAALRPAELALVADGWALAVRQARGTPGADLPALDRAAGQAAVLRALAGDVPVSESPTWSQFVSVVDSGLVGAPVRPVVVPAPEQDDGSPLAAQLAQRAQVLAVVGERREGFLPAEEGSGVRTPPRVFAGLTVAAALVLTGCGSAPEDDDRRCVDGDGTVVDDDLCDDDDDGGGVGGFFFIYGGSTYIRDGKTYVRGGSTTRPSGSFGSRSGSGGG